MRTSLLSALGLAMALTTSSVAYAGPPCGDISIRTKEIVMESSSEEGVIYVHILRSDGSYVKALGPASNAGDSVFVSTIRLGKCDLRLQYAGTADTTATDPEPADYLLPELTGRHTFVVEDPGSFSGSRSFTYTHDRRASSERALSFFAPNLKTWAGNSDLYVETSNSGLRFSFLSMWAASGHSTRHIDEFFATDDWIFPYQMDYVCSQISNCTPKDAYDVGVFLSPQTVPLGADPDFLVNSVGLDRTTSTITTPVVDRWFDSDLTLRFANGARLTISDTLDVEGVTLMGLTSSSNWSGVRVESGGSATFSNQATIDHAGIVVLNGSLTLDNARVYDAPVHGVYASGGSSAVTIMGLSEIRNSASTGVEAANGVSNIQILGNSLIENSGFANIRARGSSTVMTVYEARMNGGLGDALLADSGGEIVLDDSSPARFNSYAKGARADTYATITSDALGGDRLVQSTSSTLKDAHAVDESELDIDRIYWGPGITSSSQLSVDNCYGECVVTIDPVLTTDPGAAPVYHQAPDALNNQVATAGSMTSTRHAHPVATTTDSGPSTGESRPVLFPFASYMGTGTTRGWVESISQLARAGDADGAVDAMIQAFEAAETDLDRRIAWGGATRFAARLGSISALNETTAHARFKAFVSSTLADTESAPWAHRALAVYSLNRDRGAAQSHIDALIVSRAPVESLTPSPDGRQKLSHAAFGQLLRTQVAVSEGDETGALDALAALAALDPYQAEAEVAGLTAVFPRADVGGTVAQAQRSAAHAKIESKPQRSEATTALRVAPNPSAGHIRMYVDIVEASEVEVTVYDALGRKVATALQGSLGTGSSEVAVNLSALPAGVYVARLNVSGVEGAEAIRFTITP